jgi:hypothetical protein
VTRYSNLELQQQTTSDIVKAEGVLVSLSRLPAPVPDGAGGFQDSTLVPVVLTAKKRLLAAAAINVRSGNTKEYFQDASGQRYQVKYVMVGVVGDDIQQNDTFLYNGQLMRVIDVEPDHTFETRAQIVAWAQGS